jgi:hypothetical protein
MPRRELAVVAPHNGRENSRLNLGPREHHLPVAEAQYPVPTRTQYRVAVAIRLELFAVHVVLGAIDLDDESVADQEVDASDTRDPPLARYRQPMSSHPKPEHRFGAGLADAIYPVEPPAVGGWHGRDEVRPVVPELRHPMQEGVGDGAGEVRGLAGEHIRQTL